jgi:spore coat polysaccharide biosynthesis predicted glycosyltransferase SpsG
MKEYSLAEIFCEGNDRVGYGHIRRSLALAKQLEKDGVDVRITGLSEEARRLLPKHIISKRKAQVRIFDTPSDVDDMISKSRASGHITVALDCFGEIAPDVNIAVYPHFEVRGTRASYVGFKYILIREEISLLHRSPISEEAKQVLVFLGGGDLLNQGHETASILTQQGLEVTLVQGPLAMNKNEGAGYRVLVNPTELPQLLASSDWVVTNGGGSLFEAMCVGKATVVLPQTDAEEKIACYAEARGAILGIGLNCLRKYNQDELGIVAKEAVNLVDGCGAKRISEIVRGLL